MITISPRLGSPIIYTNLLKIILSPSSKAGIILSPSTIEVAKIKLLRMKASNIAINIALPHSIHSFLFLLVSAMKTPLLKYKRSEEHTSELQSRFDLVCRLLHEKKNRK